MEKPLMMPKLGMTMTEGTVLRWLFQPGAWVEKGEPLIEVMTDKVNMEVEAPFSGRLVQILAQDGDLLPVGAHIATFSDEKETITATSKASQAFTPVASTPAAKREAHLHQIDLHAVVQAGAQPPLKRADVLAFLQQKEETRSQGTQPQAAAQGHAAGRATPVAQKVARAHHVDLTTLPARGPGEKVTRTDVEAYLAATAASPAQALADSRLETEGQNHGSTLSPGEHAAFIDIPKTIEPGQDDEIIPLTPVRRLIGQRMLQSIATAPHIYLDTEIDMTEAERCRQSVGRSLQAKGEPAPSITALLIRAVAASLILHPEVNASLEPGGIQGKDALRRWRAVHIGVAVDTEQALLTPIIRNAHQQRLPDLARELRRLTLAARQGLLKPDELVGATFTISNLGMYGIDTFHAIIAPGQSAILAVGKVSKRGVVVEDGAGERLEIRPTMKVSLSADHRVLDGASGSRFLHQLKTFLENPYLLL